MSKQRLRLRIALTVVWAAVTAVGCTKRDDTPFGLKGDAEVHLSVGLDKTENEQTITKAGQPQIDPYKDLAVYVINTHEDTLARWASFDAVPSTLKFTPGAYKVVAEYKPGGVTLPAFEAYTYRAEEKFVIKSKDKLQIDLVAKLATTKLSVEFDPNFDFYYQSYSVDIRTVGVDSLRFAKGEARCGFFEPGSVRMRFNLVTPEGQNLVFSPSPLAKSKAADFYKLKLKVSSDLGSTQVIIIGTDDELNPEKDITVEVPRYFLPKDKPTITPKNFVSGVEQSVFEGEVPTWSMAATVPGGVSSFIIRLNDGPSGVLASKLGGETVIDLAGLPEDSPLRDKLRAAGFVWSEGLNSPDDASISTNVWVDFTDAMKAQENGDPGTYDFGFEVKDNYDQVPETDHPCVVKAEIKTSQVTFVQPVPGNIWASKADFTVTANYDMLNGTRPVLQYRRASAQNWTDASEGADGDLVISGLPKDGDLYVLQYALKGLQPGTDYVFRIVANGRPSLEYSLTTEQTAQIPNSDFNDFTVAERFGGIQQYEWTGGWATRNAATTGQTQYSKGASGDGEENPVKDVSSHSATSSVRLKDGSLAVEMQTTGWGRGTYSQQGDAGVDKGSLMGGRAGSKATDKYVANTTSGVLYLGSYQYGGFSSETRNWVYANPPKNIFSGGGTSTEVYPYDKLISETLDDSGIPFGSRPTTFTFNYLFVPKLDDGGGNFKVRAELIGEDTPGHEVTIAVAEWEDGTEQSSIAPADMGKTLSFQYDPAYLLVKAKRLKVFFSSSVMLGGVPAAVPDGFQGGNPPLTWRSDGTRHTGNTLTIKSVSLGYDF